MTMPAAPPARPARRRGARRRRGRSAAAPRSLRSARRSAPRSAASGRFPGSAPAPARPRQAALDQLQIDLGLAAARDALEQVAGKALPGRWRASALPAPSVSAGAGSRAVPRRRHAGAGQRSMSPCSRARAARPRRCRPRAVPHGPVRLLRSSSMARACDGARRSAPSGRPRPRSVRRQASRGRRLAAAQGARQGGAEHLADRVLVIVGGPAQQVDQQSSAAAGAHRGGAGLP
jgi:hypothetical protein